MTEYCEQLAVFEEFDSNNSATSVFPVAVDSNLEFFNKMALEYEDKMGFTVTFSDWVLPTITRANESKLFRDWYSDNPMNKKKLAFLRKYKPSFVFPLINVEESEDIDGN